MHKEDGKEYLSFVTAELHKRMTGLGISIEEGEKDVDEMHEYYWENYTEMDQYGYENFDNQQALLNQINANMEARNLYKRFSRMLGNPFFGRVDFVYDEEEDKEIFYIGIGNFAQEEGSTPLIFDWRAPVSGLFYDFDKGEAFYDAPMGRMHGEILSKWQYKIRNGKMLYQFESDIKIDDEILKEELGASGEDKLKNIIRTIQKEQNAIIRNTKDKILVIQGAAGSGKTSIALHRIAYLLYHDRKNLKSSNILILSPNGIFADYISQILPELGEENIREMTLDLYAYHQLKDLAGDIEDRYDQIEKEIRGLLTPRAREAYQFKQSKEFISRMEGFLLRLEDELVDFSDVCFRGETMDKDRILDLFYFKFTDIPLLSRMDAIAEYYIDQVETIRGDFNAEEKELVKEAFLKMYAFRDVFEIYNHFLELEDFPPIPDKPVGERVIPYEDVYPLMYMKYRLIRHRIDERIRHLVVDEMQDYTWLQYTLLSRMFRCSMTILGDRSQTMESESRDVFRFLPGIFGRGIRMITMNKCYRNTNEIACYANSLLGIEDMQLIGRHGREVCFETYGSLEEALGSIADEILSGEERFETAALIVLSEKESEEAACFLKGFLEKNSYDVKHRFNHLDRNSTVFRKGLTVTTFYLAKGLEFDRVYALFRENDQRDLVVQAKYIAATRAMHELTVCSYW